MGIKPKFTSTDIRKEINQNWAKIEKSIFGIIAYAGEEFVTKAKQGLSIDSGIFQKGDYTDRTANLRGSIGYFILKNGNVVKKNLKGSAEGQSAAESMLNNVQKLGKSYQLIGVAGMDYASYVEAMGYNVITSQADVVLVDLSKTLKNFAAKKGFDFDVSNGVMTEMR